MLFNSQVFLFAFLPLALLGYFVAGRFSITAARMWLVCASMFFYAWWNPPYLLLLVGSALVNYALGRALQSDRGGVPAKVLLWTGLAFNLLVIGYFKYFAFLIGIFIGVTGARIAVPDIILPLAISFFTFQKIAFLVDCYAGRIKQTSPLDYLLFVSFFPQLIAGPIVRYEEVVPQFRDPASFRFNADNLAEGLTIFLLGLAKKVVLADSLALFANTGFDGAASGGQLTFFPAWLAALAYALQLYFDFSGYSDMAIGLGRMFNIRLPLNFDSPYQAASIIEFWRRWHMTLSRFLRDYVYIPLGGNRLGSIRRYANVMLTMLIGGLWHGAGWTFVLWGALHGVFLVVNQLWRAFFGEGRPSRIGRFAAHTLTFFAVVMAWVLFRAADIGSAVRVYRGMLGFNGVLLSDTDIGFAPFLHKWIGAATSVPYFDTSVLGLSRMSLMLTFGIGVVLIAPNIHRMSPGFRLAMVAPSFALTLQQILFAQAVSPFLYFQF